MARSTKNTMTAKATEQLMDVLAQRFAKYKNRHKNIEWSAVEKRLLSADAAKLFSLSEMERTGGEPDVIGFDKNGGTYLFCDCAAESPAGRRSLCYDEKALADRKENKPGGSALELAAAMGVEILDEAGYRMLQTFGPFDQKTSSWIITPADIRKAGGALFADFRYGHVFIYHNGASSYYAARGFRAMLRV